MMRLLILGDGTFAMDVADLVDDAGGIEIVGFVRSIPPFVPGTELLGKPVLWIDEVPRYAEIASAVCALVTTHRAPFVEQVAAMGMRFTRVVHPGARVSRTVELGEGCIVSGGVQVATQTRLGRHVILNRGALVGHHNTIHDYATIGPGAVLAGGVEVGRRAYVGLGAKVLEGRTIGPGAVVGAGALVTRDVPPHTRVTGLPARVVATGVEGL